LAHAVAGADFAVLVPDLAGLARDEISGRTVADAVAVGCAAAEWPEARGGRIGLFGLSVGTTLALLAAEHPRLAKRVSAVAGVAPTPISARSSASPPPAPIRAARPSTDTRSPPSFLSSSPARWRRDSRRALIATCSGRHSHRSKPTRATRLPRADSPAGASPHPPGPCST